MVIYRDYASEKMPDNNTIIKTPNSEITIHETHGNAKYKTTLIITCHTNDIESLKKTLEYVVKHAGKGQDVNI